MAYTKQTWATGDTVTASKLNHMEDGIAEGGGGALIVTSSIVNGYPVLDKTVQEIYDALTSGTPVYYSYVYGTPVTSYISEAYLAPVVSVYTYGNNYMRVAISYPKVNETVQNNGILAVPALIIFGASSMNSNPTYVKQVYVDTDSCIAI